MALVSINLKYLINPHFVITGKENNGTGFYFLGDLLTITIFLFEKIYAHSLVSTKIFKYQRKNVSDISAKERFLNK